MKFIFAIVQVGDPSDYFVTVVTKDHWKENRDTNEDNPKIVETLDGILDPMGFTMDMTSRYSHTDVAQEVARSMLINAGFEESEDLKVYVYENET